MPYIYHQSQNIYNGILKEEIRTQHTDFNVMQGKISAIITDEDLRTLSDGGQTFYSAYASTVLTVEQLSLDFSNFSSDTTAGFTEVNSKLANYKIGLDGAIGDISSTRTELHNNYATTAYVNTSIGATAESIYGSINNLTTELHDDYSTTTQMQAAIDITAQGINQNVSSLQADLHNNYSTTSQMNTAISTTADGINTRITAINNTLTSNYSTTSQMNTAISTTASGINARISSLSDTLANDYSTTEQMNAAITATASEITSTMSRSYATKSYAEGLASTAESNAKSDTTNKLKSYYTKVDTDSLVSQTADSITTNVTTIAAGYADTAETNAKNYTDSSLGNYAQTSWVSSQITQKANEITVSVEKKIITGYVVEYALGNSATTAPTSGWSAGTPNWQTGKYIWQRTATTKDGVTSYSSPACIQGAQGSAGVSVAIRTTSVTYQASSSGTSVPSGTWSTSIPTVGQGKYLWTKTYVEYTDGTSTTSYEVARNGVDGTNGTNGTNGVGVSSVTNYYLASTQSSGVTTSTSGWTTTVQSITADKRYLWNYERISYTDSTSTTTTPCVIGVYGSTGQNGVGISSITEYYALSTSKTTAPADSAFSTTVPTLTAANRYLWNYEVVTKTDNTRETTSKRVIGVYGDTGQDGTSVSITSKSVTYQASSSGTSVPTGSWSTTIPTVDPGKYLWTRTVVNYSDGQSTISHSVSRNAVSLSKITPQYYLSTSRTTQSGGSWTTTIPTYVSGRYYWRRDYVQYDNGTSTYSTAVLDNSLNDLYAWKTTAEVKITDEAIISTVTGSNPFTTLTSRVTQTETSLSSKITSAQAQSLINQSASSIRLQASAISWTSNNSSMSSDGIMTLTKNIGSSNYRATMTFGNGQIDGKFYNSSGSLYTSYYIGPYFTLESGSTSYYGPVFSTDSDFLGIYSEKIGSYIDVDSRNRIYITARGYNYSDIIKINAVNAGITLSAATSTNITSNNIKLSASGQYGGIKIESSVSNVSNAIDISADGGAMNIKTLNGNTMNISTNGRGYMYLRANDGGRIYISDTAQIMFTNSKSLNATVDGMNRGRIYSVDPIVLGSGIQYSDSNLTVQGPSYMSSLWLGRIFSNGSIDVSTGNYVWSCATRVQGLSTGSTGYFRIELYSSSTNDRIGYWDFYSDGIYYNGSRKVSI